MHRSRKTASKKPGGDGWFVYLLRCTDGSLYTGITKNVNRRCRQHNAGTASRYTRSRRPTCLVYQEAQPSRSAALKREAAIKALSRPQKEWNDGLGTPCRANSRTLAARSTPKERPRILTSNTPGGIPGSDSFLPD